MSGNCTVWVFPVNEVVCDETIKREFSGSGKVLRIDRSSRGYCHVTYSNQEEAEHAIKTKNRLFFQGRFLNVEAAKIDDKDDKRVQDRVDRARTDWQAFCLQHFVCENWNIYECENAVPGGCCYNGHHFCLYCLAMGNGHQPHRNVDPCCPCRRPGWKELQRFNSARERELADSRPGRGNMLQQRQVESIPASGDDGGSQSLANESAARSRLVTKPANLVWTPNGGYQHVDSLCAAGKVVSQSQQPGNSVAVIKSRQDGGSLAGCNANSMGRGEGRLENTAAFSSSKQESTSLLQSSIRETGPNIVNVRFKPMVVEANKWFSVTLSSCELGPTDFNVQLTSSKNQLANIMDVINQKDLLRPLNPLEIVGGKTCLAMSRSDNIIYRGLILDYIRQSAEVYFLDYGKVEILTAEKLFIISDEQIEPPALSLRCRLSNLPNLSGSNKALAKERLKHFGNRILKCKVLRVESRGTSCNFRGKDVELRDEGSNDVAYDIQLWINDQKAQVGVEQSAARAKLKETILKRKEAHTSQVENRSEENGSKVGTKDMRFYLPERMFNKLSPRSKRNPSNLCAPGKKTSAENGMSFAGDGLSSVAKASKMYRNSFAGNLSNNALLAHKMVQLTIPTNKLDAVLGPNGARLQQIRRESMASISVGSSGADTVITIRGSFKVVQTAREMIQQGLDA